MTTYRLQLFILRVDISSNSETNFRFTRRYCYLPNQYRCWGYAYKFRADATTAANFWLMWNRPFSFFPVLWLSCIAQIPLRSSRHVSTRHVRRVERIETIVSSRAVLFDKPDTAKMHGLDTSNVSSRVETW